MLFRFCNLCCKSADSPFVKLSRHYAKAVAKEHTNEGELHDVSPETKKGKVTIIECKRKNFNFYKGMAYKKKEIIPLASQSWNHRKSKGDYFHIYPFYEDGIEELDDKESPTFDNLNLNPAVLNQLENFEIRKPLEIQQLGIPKVLSGHHTLLTAETGCGKTLAYLLPLLSQILHWKTYVQNPMNSPFVIIVTPTRELAVQIGIESIKWCKPLGINIKMQTGGRTKKKMLNPPIDRVDILVGSFGVISKLFSVGVYKRNLVRCVVLDEVDALFHETFEYPLKAFLQKLPIGYHQNMDGFPETVQLILASATVPSRMEKVLGDIINVDSLAHVTTGKLHRILVPQKFVRTSPSDKPAMLLKYIKPKAARKEPVIVFSNSNTTSYWMKLFLNECGVPTTNLHGSMPLYVRVGKYGEFINGHACVLSTTNAGSRGLDTVMVNHILNYDFPMDTASYIHRCGRTGRVGTIGDCKVTNFICRPKEIVLTQKIEWATRRMKPIPIVNLEYSDEKAVEEEEEMLPEVEYNEQIIESLDGAEEIPY